MDLLPSPEQEEIVGSISAFLRAELPMARVRELAHAPSSRDAATWPRCAALGWFGLGLPETAGGVGYGAAEEALLFREIGRHLAPGPFLPTVLAAHVAVAAGASDVTAAILDGTTAVGLATTGARATVDGCLTADLVLYDAVDAELVLVADADGAALYETAALSDVVTHPCIDPTTRLATARAEGLSPVAVAGAAADPPARRGAVLAAAAASGIAEAARDLSSEHARTRVQFGKPIGTYQAVKHACADMAVRAEAATSQTFLAALALGDGAPDAAFQSAAAKIVAVDAALANARATVQIHGGMGFTAEHDAHLLVKRAHVLAVLFGDRRQHLRAALASPR